MIVNGRKAARANVATSLLMRVINISFGIIIPKLYLDSFGSEINGLLNSIAGIFVYLDLLEAGIGGAAIQALYKTLVKNEEDKTNGIMAATNKLYQKTGLYFLACVSILAFVYPVAVHSSLNYYFILCLVLLSAIPTLLRYFFMGKYNVLLIADNKGYVINILSTAVNMASNIAKIICIFLGFDIIKIQIIYAAINVAQILIMQRYVHKNYLINLKVQENYAGIKNSKYVLVHNIASTIFNNTDTLVLTLVCGLKVVSVYSIYNLLFTQAGLLIKGIASSIQASFGQLYIADSKKFVKWYLAISAVYKILTFSSLTVIGIFCGPFIQIYTAGIVDIEYYDKYLPFLFMIMATLDTMRWTEVIAINSTGFFKETVPNAIIETAINLTISIVLVFHIGIYGVLIGSIAALLYRSTDMIIFVSKHICGIPFEKNVSYIFISLIVAITMYLHFTKYLYLVKLRYSGLIVPSIILWILSMVIFSIIAIIFDKESVVSVREFILSKRKNGEKL